MRSRKDQIESFRKLIASGEIKLGMTRTEIRSLLGEPDDMGGTSRRYKTPMIYKYEDVELGFGKKSDDGLMYVYLDETGSEDFVSLLIEGDPDKPYDQ